MRSLLRVAFLASTTAALATGQAQWQQLSPPASPPPVDGVRMAWDCVRQEVLMFGGDGHSPRDETWSFDGTTWTRLSPTNSPAGRVWFAMACDSVRQRVVLHGGTTFLAGATTTTFEWDGSNWQRQNVATAPPIRTLHAMAFDANRGEMVMFGGFTTSTPLSDTWTYDGTTWTQRLPATTPPGRGWHAMAYDPVRDQVVMFGGYAGGNSQPFSDTWTWDGSDWQLRAPSTTPPGQLAIGMAYDRSRQRIVMSPGFERPAQGTTTWEWDGSDWRPTTNGTGPIGNWDNGLAYDEVRRQVVHFGGRSGGTGQSDQTWIHASANPAELTPFGAGCSGSSGTPALAAVRYPWLGLDVAASLEPIPANQPALFVVGLSDSAWPGGTLPVELTAVGMPGCFALVSLDLLLTGVTTGTTASWSMPIGSNPSLVGGAFFVQGIALDPGAGTPFPAVTSNALRAVIGSL